MIIEKVTRKGERKRLFCWRWARVDVKMVRRTRKMTARSTRCGRLLRKDLYCGSLLSYTLAVNVGTKAKKMETYNMAAKEPAWSELRAEIQIGGMRCWLKNNRCISFATEDMEKTHAS
jgi:hypothetical protein